VDQNIKSAESYETSFVKIIVGRYNEENYSELFTYIDSKCSNYDNVTVESKEDYEPGEYIALVEIDWRQDIYKEFVFQTYSSCDSIEL